MGLILLTFFLVSAFGGLQAPNLVLGNSNNVPKPRLSLKEKITCLDEEGAKTSWFVALKAPEGLQYVYVDGKSKPVSASQANFSPYTLAGGGAIARSIGRIYDESLSSDIGVLGWNDAWPVWDERSKKLEASWGAHAKGVLMFNDVSGMLLVHSVPNFPPPLERGYPPEFKKGYAYTDTGVNMGQSFVCLSLDAAGVRDAIEYLYTIRAGIYINRVSESLRNSPVYNVINNSRAPLLSILDPRRKGFDKGTEAKMFYLTSTGKNKQKFVLFAKPAKWAKRLFEDLVTEFVGSLVAETWTRGALEIVAPSNCDMKGRRAYNAHSLNIAGTTWYRNSDHSKWAIALLRPFVCVGDLNRQTSQDFRGGGTVCSEELDAVYTLMQSAIVTINPCGVKNGGPAPYAPQTALPQMTDFATIKAAEAAEALAISQGLIRRDLVDVNKLFSSSGRPVPVDLNKFNEDSENLPGF